ncbi:ABC transporter substrate-binding protein [Tepidimonas sediminis]|nr:ABC transporter substrate-binding protein [Tepidimonas sediminis]
MDRRRCCAGMATLGLLAAWPWPAVRAAGRVVVHVQDNFGLRALPLRLAERLGYCAQEGVVLRWTPEPTEEGTAQEGGSAAVYLLSLDRLARRVLAGADLRVAAALVRAPQFAIGVSAQTGELSADFWREARVGVPLGQEVAAQLAARVLAQGWSSAPVHWWPLETPDAAVQALQRGTVQALVWGDPLLTRLERAGALRLLADLRHPQQAQRWLGGPLLCAVLAAEAAQFDAHGEVLRRLVAALQRALAWLHAASSVDLAVHADVAGLAQDRATFLGVVERLRPTYSVEAAVPLGALRHSLRLLASLPGGLAYQTLDPLRLLPSRGWT